MIHVQQGHWALSKSCNCNHRHSVPQGQIGPLDNRGNKKTGSKKNAKDEHVLPSSALQEKHERCNALIRVHQSFCWHLRVCGLVWLGQCVCAVCVQCVGVFGHKFDTTPLPHTPLQPLHVRSLKPNKRARAFLRSMSLARYRTWVQSCYPGGHACHTSCLTPPPVPQPRRSQQRWY
jgi:hypothetical protein